MCKFVQNQTKRRPDKVTLVVVSGFYDRVVLFTIEFYHYSYNGNNGHAFTKKPDLAFWVLSAISGIKFYFFKKFFLGFILIFLFYDIFVVFWNFG